MWSVSVPAPEGISDTRSDERVLVKAAQASPAAFGALYELYVTRVYRYLRTHCQSDEDAADLTQHVFLRALDALPGYRAGGAPFGAWLFRIARHAAIDAHRRARSTIAWERMPEALHPGSGRDPEDELLRREALGRLQGLLAALDSDKRELLALRFAAQLSAPEIAAVVGKRPDAVKRQLTRIIHGLKEAYHGA